MSSNAPIGVFDSGIGGLTVVKELIELMPGEDYIYFGDTARMPYGPRPKEQIVEFMHEILHFFTQQKVKMAVVACNTMTALGIELARSQYPFPLVGVSSGIDLALSVSPSKNIGVIATQATIASEKHAKTAKDKDKEAIVFSQPCPKLVPLIENEQIEGSEIESAVAEYLLPMKEAGVEALILGCTHYPFVTSVIKKIVGNDMVLINPARETAMDAYRILQEQDNLAAKMQGKTRLCFSAEVEQAKKMAGYMLDIRQAEFQLINLQK